MRVDWNPVREKSLEVKKMPRGFTTPRVMFVSRQANKAGRKRREKLIKRITTANEKAGVLAKRAEQLRKQALESGERNE